MTDEKSGQVTDEDMVIVMTDEEGNESYYREDLVVPVGEKRFAVLVPITPDDEMECGCEHDDEEECDCCGDASSDDAFVARIDVSENGEDIYVDPTDEEFEEFLKAYDELVSEDEE